MESVVRFLNYAMSPVTDKLRELLVMMNIQPDLYIFLFPAGKGAEAIRLLAASGSFPVFAGLAPSITYAFLLGIARFVFQYALLQPLAKSAMKITYLKFARVAEIERSFPASEKVFNIERVKKFSQDMELDESYVHTYFWARRRNVAMKRRVAKFVEAAWRFLLYSICCVIGYYTLYHPTAVDYVSDTNQLWQGWPDHPLSLVLEFYYVFQLGAYLHQLMWTEVNRSDATEMIIHHCSTILLLVFSYLTNFTRVGACILLLHDTSDVLLESAKVFNYTSKVKGQEWTKHICDVVFVAFAVTFVVTRLILYPRYIIGSVFFQAPGHFGRNWIGYWVFCVLLVILQCLHVFWAYLIGRMVYRLLTTGIEKDERSEDEEDVHDNDTFEEYEQYEEDKAAHSCSGDSSNESNSGGRESKGGRSDAKIGGGNTGGIGDRSANRNGNSGTAGSTSGGSFNNRKENSTKIVVNRNNSNPTPIARKKKTT